MRIDLHIHTTASDGCWTPAETVQHVQEAGIGLFAVCDHDALDSVMPAAAQARQRGLAFLPAAEVSALLDGVGLLHILAYGIDPCNAAFREMLGRNRQRLTWNNEETLRRMIQAGYPVDLAAYEAYTNNPRRGGWRVLNFLIDCGICRDVHDFFERIYVDPIRPPWPDFPHPAEVAAVVRQAGGLPVLAHPGASLHASGVSAATLAPFVDYGIAGIECYTPYHDEATTQTCLDFCRRHDLLITGGSDCHGPFIERPIGALWIELEHVRLGPLEAHVLRPDSPWPWGEGYG